MKIHEKVRQYIDTKGIKHSVVAKNAGISRNTFSAIMNGKRTMYAEEFASICNALEVNASEFISDRRET